MKKVISTFIILFIAYFFIGCELEIPQYSSVDLSRVQKKNLSKQEKLLLRRFAQYWNYRLKRDFAKTFSYELPYQKYITSFDYYKDNLIYSYGKGKIILDNIYFKDKNHAIITKEYINRKGEHFKDKEDWYYVIDNWYHKFYQYIMPPD